MKIGLISVGSQKWMGGVYYISNLVRALRTLPEQEQPEITLILPSDGDKNYYDEISQYVEFFSYPVPNKVSPEAKNKLKQLLSRSQTALALGRRINRQFIESSRYQSLAQSLLDKEISALFPCLDSMGSDFSIPWVGWVWDLQHKYYPDFFSGLERQERDLAFKQLGIDARLIVTSSYVAQSDFEDYFPGWNQKLRVLHFRTIPTADWFVDNVDTVKRKYGLPDRYFMVPNQFWVHKNHWVAFKAAKILKDRGVDFYLVCTGNTHDHRHPNYFDQLKDYLKINHLEDRVFILGLIPRREQIQLMRGAAAVIQPSLFEGWSTVVEDARVLGKRIFLSNIPVHLEQSPLGAIYFDSYDYIGLADKIVDFWDALVAGPNLLDEKNAQEAQYDLILEYARMFLKIIGDASSLYSR